MTRPCSTAHNCPAIELDDCSAHTHDLGVEPPFARAANLLPHRVHVAGEAPPFRDDLLSRVLCPLLRRKLLHSQEAWVADDQAAFALCLIAQCAPWPVRVLDPVHAQCLVGNAGQGDAPSTLGGLQEGDSLVSMLLVDNPWVAVSWTVRHEKILEWSTQTPGGPCGDMLGTADSLIAKATAAFKILSSARPLLGLRCMGCAGTLLWLTCTVTSWACSHRQWWMPCKSRPC